MHLSYYRTNETFVNVIELDQAIQLLQNSKTFVNVIENDQAFQLLQIT